MSTASRPVRADAERNRLRILEAAGALFAERGLDVSMEQIAIRAGVGVGTVYRRFGDRDALLDALFEVKIARITQIGRDALEIEDPWTALETFIRGAAHEQAMDQGLKEILLSASRGTERMARARESIQPLAQQLLGRARAAGAVRPDVSEFDIPMLQFAIAYVADRVRDVAPEYHGRLLAVMLDGLRAEATPMPAPPLTEQQFLAAAAGR